MNKKLLFFSLLLVVLLHFLLISFFTFNIPLLHDNQKLHDEPVFLKFILGYSKIDPTIETIKTQEKIKNTRKVEKTTNSSLETPPLSSSNLQNLNEEINSKKPLKELSKSQDKKNLDVGHSKKSALSEVLPMSGKLSILVYYGNYTLDASPIGKGYLEVIYPGKNSYDIKLSAKVVGWASVFYRKPLIFQSIGTISEKGLTPNLYKENTPKRGENYVKVQNLKKTLYFSSTNQTVKYKNEELHDPLSLIFHLAWLSQKKLKIEFKKLSSFYVFNRKKLKEIKLIADLPEEIVLPGGVLVEAIKIKSKIIESKRPGIMTFWLDPADNFLPVRISYKSEKTKKSLDFLVLREGQNSSFGEEKNNINQNKQINPHPYLPNY